MKLTVARDVLAAALKRAHSVIPSRSLVPIEQHCRIEAVRNKVTIAATDHAIVLAQTLPATQARAGFATAPVALFDAMVRQLPEGADVALEADGTFLHVRCGRFAAKLNMLAPEEFPALDVDDVAFEGKLPATDFGRILSRVKDAASREQTRANLNGVYLHTEAEPPALKSAATDGTQMAVDQMAIWAGAAARIPAIVLPTDVVTQLVALCEGQTGDNASIMLKISARMIEALAGDIVLTAKLLDVTFPDYRRVVPTNSDRRGTLKRAELHGALDRMLAVTGRGQAVTAAFGAGGLTLSGCVVDKFSERHEAVEELTVSFEGEPLAIGFNGARMLAILSRFTNDGVTLAMRSPGDPILIRSMDGGDGFDILMPMRVGALVEAADA